MNITDIIKSNVKLSKGQGGEYYVPWDVADFIYPQIKEFVTWSDDYSFCDSPLIDQLIGCRMMDFKDYYFEVFEKLIPILNECPKKYKYFGDIDWGIKLIKDTKDKSVFVVSDYVTCSDICKWIVILDRSEWYNNIHIRIIYDKADYPKQAYPDKVNLKFWKDRKFICDYVDEYHMTNKGGIYGDIRDKGYVISYMKINDPQFTSFDNNILEMNKWYCFYNEWHQFTRLVNYTDKQLRNEEN